MTSKFSNVRLLDVFLLGPMQIVVSFYVKNRFLHFFMFLTGFLNILYNGNNYLYLDLGLIDKPFLQLLNIFISKYGKTQIHRIYNLLIMYPLFFYIWKYEKNIPKKIKTFFIFQIILGFMFNLYNLTKINFL